LDDDDNDDDDDDHHHHHQFSPHQKAHISLCVVDDGDIDIKKR